MISFVAKCFYEGKEQFGLWSTRFKIAPGVLLDLEEEAVKLVRSEWERCFPFPCPEHIEIEWNKAFVKIDTGKFDHEE